MNSGKTLFAQLMACMPWTSFGRIVDRHGGDFGVRTFPCSEQFRAMAFAQLTWRESLRDVEACLAANPAKLYGMGFRQPVRRSTLADANERRDWRIWADVAMLLIRRARKLYCDDAFALDLDNTVYALDSTTIDLCLSLFDWAPFRSTKAAIKLHTLLDLRGSIPTFIHISDGKMHDVRVLDMLPIEAGAFYVMDRGYLDFERLYALHQQGAFFVTRAKRGMDARRVTSMPSDRENGVICDQRIALNGYYGSRNYPEQLRRVRYKDAETGKTLVFLTNHKGLPALTICALYKQRWRVELFFGSPPESVGELMTSERGAVEKGWKKGYSASRPRTRGSAPGPPGFIAWSPETVSEQKEKRAGMLRLSQFPGPDRRSGRIPALPYPPPGWLMMRQIPREG